MGKNYKIRIVHWIHIEQSSAAIHSSKQIIRRKVFDCCIAWSSVVVRNSLPTFNHDSQVQDH